MSWTYLIAATMLDAIATVLIKQSAGFSKLMPTFFAVVTFALSLVALSLALQRLEIIPVYLVSVGLGTALVTVMGVVLFHEVLSPLKLVSLVLVCTGVLGLIFASQQNLEVL